MANYLHGVETIELNIGPRPISVVKSAVIALVGIAPEGPRQTLTLVQTQSDAAQFGAKLPGFNIPKALEAIQRQGAGTVIVVNVFNPETHTEAVTETKTVVNGKFRTTDAPIIDAVLGYALVLTNGETGDDLVTYVPGTDYTVNKFGDVTIVAGGAISEGATITCIYRKLDGTAVANADIIGSIDSDTGARTGFKLYELMFNQFGFNPRILIAPGYSSQKAIAEEMISKAVKFRGHTLLDRKTGTPTAALAARGNVTESFGTSSKRAVLCYPGVKAYDDYSQADEVQPYSQFMAGVIAATDNTDGYWFSPSNREVRGITGLAVAITAAVNDPQTEANLLNEAGIVTLFNTFGTGLRTWGNRSAAFPTSTAPSNFIAVQRTADILHESLELAMLQFIDQPINNALIDAIRDSVNGFIRTLIQRGAIIDGECTYDPAKNPPTQVAAGQLVFDIAFMPPTPAERITFESFIDINLLANLGTQNN
jgi:uncharacterized protein